MKIDKLKIIPLHLCLPLKALASWGVLALTVAFANNATAKINTPTLPHKIRKQQERLASQKDPDKLWNEYLRLKKCNRPEIQEISDGNPGPAARKGIKILKRIIKIDPKHHKARFELAMLYYNAAAMGLITTDKTLPFLKKAVAVLEALFTTNTTTNLKQEENLKYTLWLLDMYRSMKFYMHLVYNDKQGVSELNQKTYRLIKRTVTQIPPEELPHGFLSPDIADCFFEKNDIKGAVDFFNFLDMKIGTGFYKPMLNLFYGDSPLGLAVYILSQHKKYDDAKKFLNKCKISQPEMYEIHRKSLEALLNPNKTNEEKSKIFRQDCPKDTPVFDKNAKFAELMTITPLTSNRVLIPYTAKRRLSFLPEQFVLKLYRAYQDCEMYIVHTSVKPLKRHGDSIVYSAANTPEFTDIFIVDNAGKIRKKLRISEVYIKGAELVGDSIYIINENKFFSYNLKTGKKTLYDNNPECPKKTYTSMFRKDDKLWISRNAYWGNYKSSGWKEKPKQNGTVLSFSLKDKKIKIFPLYKNDDDININKMIPGIGSTILLYTSSYMYSFDTETGEKTKRCAIEYLQYPVYCDTQLWIPYRNEIRILFPDNKKQYLRNPSLEIMKRTLAAPLSYPFYGEIDNSISKTGEYIWISSTAEKKPRDMSLNMVTAYNFKNKTWYGPFIFPYEVKKVYLNKKGILLFCSDYNDYTLAFDISSILKLATENSAAYTAEQYRKMVSEKFRKAGTCASGVYKLLEHYQYNKNATELFNKSLANNPGDYRALFWKAFSSEKSSRIKIYQSVIDNAEQYPPHIINLATQELKELKN